MRITNDNIMSVVHSKESEFIIHEVKQTGNAID